MALKYGFFDSVSGDRKYSADDLNNLFKGVTSDTGVFKLIGDNLRVTPYDGLTVNVSSGRGSILNRWFDVDSDGVHITIGSAHSTYTRYEYIIAKYDKSNRVITIEKLAGVAEETPTLPELTQTDSIYMLPIAYVKVEPGTTSITENMIYQVVGIDSYCPFISFLNNDNEYMIVKVTAPISTTSITLTKGSTTLNPDSSVDYTSTRLYTFYVNDVGDWTINYQNPNEQKTAVVSVTGYGIFYITVGYDFPTFNYTGSYRYFQNDPSTGILEFYTSGDLRLDENASVDLCIIGGGGNGGNVENTSEDACAGAGGGGGGGYMLNEYSVSLSGGTNYALEIGSAGNPSSIGALNYIAQGGLAGSNNTNGGAGGAGGSGGGGGLNSPGITAGSGGTGGSNGSNGYASSSGVSGGAGDNVNKHMFGINDDDHLFCGGGGGGTEGYSSGAGGVGGAGGGGTGGKNSNGYSATKYGGGGGGAGGYIAHTTRRTGGTGYQGVIFMRKHTS